MTLSYATCFYLAFLFATPSEGKWDFKYVGRGADTACGRVLTVTKTAISVSLLRKYNTRKADEILIFPLHNRLACGSFNLLESEGYIYRRDDVKVGDLVNLRTRVENKIDYCVSINIWERPGGKLPPTFLSRPTDWQPNYEARNARNALEREKIPIPSHLSDNARPSQFPAFDPRIPKADRLKRFPYDRPFSYIEFALFMR